GFARRIAPRHGLEQLLELPREQVGVASERIRSTPWADRPDRPLHPPKGGDLLLEEPIAEVLAHSRRVTTRQTEAVELPGLVVEPADRVPELDGLLEATVGGAHL